MVEESTLSYLTCSTFRERLCEVALRRCVRKHVLLGKLEAERYSFSALVSGVPHALESGL